ncbi:MAG: J domain-containing protein [Verrucomicrobiota bacterium]|nr:J domain-containing protein [Verrucomicrobiota bacterium]
MWSNPSESRAIVFIDKGPLLKKARKEYASANKSLQTLEGQLEVYEREDIPLFQQWMAKEFGAELTKIRELTEALHLENNKLYRIEDQMDLGYTHYEAYDRVINDVDLKEELEAEAKEDSSSEFPPGSDDPSEEESKQADAFEDLFEDMMNGFFEGSASPQKPPPQANKNQVKNLYRQIVRILHPDRNESFTDTQKELWTQTQQAYSEGDLETLELILSRCEHGGAGVEKIDRLSSIKNLTKMVKQRLNAMRGKLRALKKNPAYQFSKLTDASHIKMHFKEQISFDLAYYQTSIRRTAQQLNQFKNAHALWVKAGSPKRSVKAKGNVRRNHSNW